MKTAVILSARLDRDTSVPYPLKAYHDNVCLMDRTIEALTALDYSEIYLVVGGASSIVPEVCFGSCSSRFES
mgnify:CR=1 FL=1